MEYPKLLWSPEGVEVTVCSPQEEEARAAEGYTTTQPGAPVPEQTESESDESGAGRGRKKK